MILFSAIYRNYSLENNFLSFYHASNVNFKNLLKNDIIKKYHYLLIEKHHVKYNSFDYINQLVRLRAELLQSVSKVRNFSLILYDQNVRIIFSNFNTQGHDYEQLLTNDEIDKLLSNQEIFYATKDTLISIFPIFHEDDIKPSFLKIIQSYNNSYIMIYSLFSIFMGLLLVTLILIMLYLHFFNTQMLAKQHKTNIELQRIKEALEQESANKLNFASVTHELRTPLNAIIRFAS